MYVVAQLSALAPAIVCLQYASLLPAALKSHTPMVIHLKAHSMMTGRSMAMASTRGPQHLAQTHGSLLWTKMLTRTQTLASQVCAEHVCRY